MIDVKSIDALLPQTQCGECGFSGCLPYAQAMGQGIAPIDRCPPGGAATVIALGRLLKIDPEPYVNASLNTRQPATAVIREEECIGCTKCIQACPVDAIIGTGKRMHSILADECTGCGLCIEPCPVDCIDLVSVPEPLYQKEKARTRYQAREIRKLRQEHEHQQNYREKRKLAPQTMNEQQDKRAKQDYILLALERAKQKLHE
jgi:electron transport complex protein RnfB